MKISRSHQLILAATAVVAIGVGAYALNGQQKSSSTTKSATNQSSSSVTKKQQTSSNASDTSSNKSQKMNIQAIKNGDFSSVAGTWQNQDGNGFTFDKHGLVSVVYSGQSRTDQNVYGDYKQGPVKNASIEKGYLKTFVGAKLSSDDVGASSMSSLYFIPKGVELDNTSNSTVDRLYSGQQMSDNNIYYRVDTKAVKEADSLSEKDKETLALLGMPDGFQSNYGKTTVADLLAEKANPTVMNPSSGFSQQATTFKGIKIQNDNGKYLLKLLNVPSDIEDRDESEGYFRFNGDTITYKVQGTRVQGAEQDQYAQTKGTQSLSKLYQQYKGTDKFKQVQKLIQS
ncbi:DUF6287 domain-containing protein [Fructobacillus evanidus]|uniref:DUF6287 domain-containing protein n=1 Tax=Fructobacillus evanidus TaxID=3064281 RepID=A0ABM9N2M2_9LACO|nr:hypothetical protein R53718_MFFEMHAI_01408 [Fructobacillus sp. LMG 32999]CAK1246248.1 hypothetical protein R55250_KEHBDPNM_01470 [Fructobacillus sp. LMG 32999]CAK1253203.1 hypothetical protein R54837_OMAIDLJD_01460 [Fructobacillus sp. LMG 32999]CAK1253215.1 hypothetical protein R55203_MFJFHIJN_01437 [Fructobacillus sp. LMG 32999]CAK1253330.1 hypothetical protein R53534_HOPDCFKK_01460 [Fructobacillus sp. LMG 32999]